MEPILSPLGEEGFRQGGSAFQDALQGGDRIVGDRFDQQAVVVGQSHQRLAARLEADLLAERHRNEHLALGRSTHNWHIIHHSV
jgi:hypothetical protein